MAEPLANRERAAELDAAATPGPWFFDGRDVLTRHNRGDGHYLVIPLPETWHESQGVNKADAQFIAETRTLLPALAAECVRLTADNEKLDAEVAQWMREFEDLHETKMLAACEECSDRLDVAEREVARYRTTLGAIADSQCMLATDRFGDTYIDTSAPARIARAALAGENTP